MENTVVLKPLLRGHLHGMAFLVTLGWTFVFLMASIFYKFDLPIFIYLMSQLLLFGVSACYHIFNWSPSVKNFLRVCDHICIFFLISGTQTSILLSVLPRDRIAEAFGPIKVSWAISLVGVLRLILIRQLYDIFDLICYIVHGCAVLSYFNLYKLFSKSEIIFAMFGGLFYLLGGLVYGMERPNLIPHAFGFHELFHLCTIFANASFGVIISKKYIFNILNTFVFKK